MVKNDRKFYDVLIAKNYRKQSQIFDGLIAKNF